MTPRVRPTRASSALAGTLAAGVALGVTELAAGLTGGRSLVVAVGDWVINHAPNGLVEFGTRNFGTDDKAVLVTVVVVASLVFGAWVGLVARRHFLWGALAITAFGIVGFLAALSDHLHDTGSAAFATIAGVAAGVATLRVLLRAAARGPAADEVTGGSRLDRRAFLGLAAGAAVIAGTSALLGRSLLASGTRAVAAARRALKLPPAGTPVTLPTAGMDVGVTGVTPLVTANDDFYRIDTAITFPQIDYQHWQLRIHGMVDRPFDVTFDALAAMELIEQYATIQCVSNDVGGNLVSTAAWRGVRLSALLSRAGVSADADQVVGRSVEGFTVGFPTTAALDARGAMVAIGMNGSPLPIEHGFPARLIVPGLYGYVSATKWLSDIELTRFDRYDAYWVQRGWTQQGPIGTQSRIDVPSGQRTVRAKTVAVAGVAWAPTRGISKVEVQVDEDSWQEATLADALSTDTWRQWVYHWGATPGQHRLRVRATDGSGAVQDGHDQPPGPSGATGYHTINVNVAE
jgi:DMSO/TMAO reductase YedYZ molybdopterin-dependent catalytic subunit